VLGRIQLDGSQPGASRAESKAVPYQTGYEHSGASHATTCP
jgi:hypothetical protein